MSEKQIVHLGVLDGKTYAIVEPGEFVFEPTELTMAGATKAFNLRFGKGNFEIRRYSDPTDPSSAQQFIELMKAAESAKTAKIAETEPETHKEAEKEPQETGQGATNEPEPIPEHPPEQPIKPEPVNQGKVAEPEEIILREVVRNATPAETKLDRLIEDLRIAVYEFNAERVRQKEINKELQGNIELSQKALFNAREGKEMEHVSCKVIRDYDRDLKLIVRLDNGEVLEEIPLSMAEKQIQMDLNTEKQAETEPTDIANNIYEIAFAVDDLHRVVAIIDESGNCYKVNPSELRDGEVIRFWEPNGNEVACPDGSVTWMTVGEPYRNADHILCIKCRVPEPVQEQEPEPEETEEAAEVEAE